MAKNKVTVQQIEEVLCAVKACCGKHTNCTECPLSGFICGKGDDLIFPEYWTMKEVEKIAEVIANERD